MAILLLWHNSELPPVSGPPEIPGTVQPPAPRDHLKLTGRDHPRFNEAVTIIPTSEIQDAELAGDPLPQGAVRRLGTARLRHAGSVRDVAFSKEGRWLASLGDDHSLVVWDGGSGREIRRLPSLHYAANALFLPDNRLVTGGGDGTTLIWDLALGIPALRLVDERHDGYDRGQTLAVSVDGTQLATAANTQIQLWNVNSGRALRRIPTGSTRLLAIDFAVQGRCLYSINIAGRVHIWDTASGEPFQAFPDVPGIAQVAAASNSQNIRLYDVARRSPVADHN